MPGQVCILMASYNGAAFLPAQLESLTAQTHRDWQMIVADDGSDDATTDIMAAFGERLAAEEPARIKLCAGPGKGATANFMALLANAPDRDWIALADQDDVWMPDRLSRGISALSALPPDQPALYCSRTLVTDIALQNPRPSRAVPRPPGFRNALLQNIAAGNTILLNRAAMNLVRRCGMPDIPAHDWWLYLLVSGCGGRVIHDPEPTLYYRQHGGNEVGVNRGWRASRTRLAMLLAGRLARWCDANLAALETVKPHLTPENRSLVAEFAALRRAPLWPRLRRFGKLGLYRQNRMGQAAMWVALALGRL